MSDVIVHAADGTRSRVRLEDRDLIGEGGEGRVYRLASSPLGGDVAVKIFLTPDEERAKKLRAFPSLLPAQVAAPLALCTRPKSTDIVGYVMRALRDAVDMSRLGSRHFREAARISNNDVLRIFRELSDIVAKLHSRGIVVGDLNDGNVMLAPTGLNLPAQLTPWLIDADSMQFAGFRCVVAHERFLDPQLYNVDLRSQSGLTSATDFYALAVMLFASLLYIHPFGGAHPQYPTMLRRAEARVSVLRADVKLPKAAVAPSSLTDDALAWFVSTFEKDVREPLPAALLETRFVRCSCGIEHARSSCPACSTHVHVAPIVSRRGNLRATRIFKTRGRIVNAVMQAGLKHAHEVDGALLREDDVVVTRGGEFFEDPHRIVRIAGPSTWLFANGRGSRVMAETILESTPLGARRGADAGSNGLVHTFGDSLLRAENGTRIGQVLEAQTHVRVGDTLGFAFYRVGEITVAFVFDPRRGTLRQIEAMPPIQGKLLEWSAVFDGMAADRDHVLVTFATERAGHVVHVVHLIDSRGEIVASDKSVLPASLTGRTISNGNVIVASDDEGLVLFKADRQTHAFVPVRAFPEAKEYVCESDELLVGPNGSLYVVQHTEITHLVFT